jgi:hypothetical protein
MAASLGIVSDTITEGGWILTTIAAVTLILLQLEALCVTLPSEAPVIIYCLDNSSFSATNKEAVLLPTAKLKDNLYHVMGEMVTMAAAITFCTGSPGLSFPLVPAYPVSTIPAANLPPVSTTPVANSPAVNLPPVSATPVANNEFNVRLRIP